MDATKRILVLGYFGYTTNQLDGQTIKTREIYKLIKDRSQYEVFHFDSQSFKTSPLNLLNLIKLIRIVNVIVYLPGQNNLKWVFPIIQLFKNRSTQIVYPVVGGWLDTFLHNNKRLIKPLSDFKFIGVETQRLKNSLERLYGFKNVEILTNFRSQEYLPFKNIFNGTLRIVFMARITESKGCNTIFEIARRLKKDNIGNIKITFYGQIDPEYRENFYRQLEESKEICNYEGIVQPKDVYLALNQHDVLILPTYYEGEGFPGSIVDAYKAGIPVIISRWKDLPEFVVEDKTGFIINVRNLDEYYHKILELMHNPEKLAQLKKQAFEQSKKYSADEAWRILFKKL